MNDGKTGERIKELRKNNHLTQKELGALIGKTESSIRKYEKGLIEIPTSVIDLLAKTLKTTPAFLLGYEKIQKELDRYKLFRNILDLLGCTFEITGCFQYWNNPLPSGDGFIHDDGEIISGCTIDKKRHCKNCDIKEPVYHVAYNGTTTDIPVNIFDNLQDETEEFIKFKLQQLMDKYK